MRKLFETEREYVRIPAKSFRAMQEKIVKLEFQLSMEKASSYYLAIQNSREIMPVELLCHKIMNNISSVKLFRKYRGYTQQELADKIGISKTMISHIENGKKQGSARTLKNIADVLNINMDELIQENRSEDKKSSIF
ncbi:MAG: helix-turn-helix domain-containing protein [Alphaproteobacteria bacterium]|nr:helix-turn-helix domain-containing protein [Alphaproteobacteria bacterium]